MAVGPVGIVASVVNEYAPFASVTVVAITTPAALTRLRETFAIGFSALPRRPLLFRSW